MDIVPTRTTTLKSFDLSSYTDYINNATPREVYFITCLPV